MPRSYWVAKSDMERDKIKLEFTSELLTNKTYFEDVQRYIRREISLTDLAEKYGVSRQTLYTLSEHNPIVDFVSEREKYFKEKVKEIELLIAESDEKIPPTELFDKYPNILSSPSIFYSLIRRGELKTDKNYLRSDQYVSSDEMIERFEELVTEDYDKGSERAYHDNYTPVVKMAEEYNITASTIHTRIARHTGKTSLEFKHSIVEKLEKQEKRGE